MTDRHAPDPLADRLDAARQDLLELSTRNRLLSTPRRRKRARALEVVDEKSDELYRLLVEGGATLTFEPASDEALAADRAAEAQEAAARAAADAGPPPTDPAVEPGSAGAALREGDSGAQPADAPALEQPAEDEDDAEPIVDPDRVEKRHRDLKLQTALSSADLQKRLLRTYYDARSSELEQGVNTLYLALGFLKWYEDDTTEKARYAPLVLVPVTLSRKNARTQFSIAWNEDEVSTNLSLQAKLKADFGLELPELVTDAVTGVAAGASDGAADSDGAVGEARSFRPSDYFAVVRDMLRDVKRWEVCADDVVLSFFSFSKFLMYRDLDPGEVAGDGPRAAALSDHPLLGALMGEGGFAPADPVLAEGQSLDEVVSPRDTVHVTLADTSQASAVEAVRRGQNLVIQGPPGTGKSQTITNLIAAAVKEGKTVLFVAEKMAALEVVKRRLSNAGLGDMCLELHSHKARKRRVLDDLQRTLGLGAVTGTPDAAWFEKLAAARAGLTEHARALHAPVDGTGVTPFDAVGELVRLRARGVKPGDFTLDDPLTWTPDAATEARGVLRETLARLEEVGPPAEHPWRGASAPGVTPMDLERMSARLPDASAALRGAAQRTAALADALRADGRATAGWAASLAGRARRMAEQPALDAGAIVNEVWAQQGTPLSALVEQGQHLSQAKKQLAGKVVDAAWGADAAALSQTRIDLAAHGASWLRFLSGAYRRAKATLRGLCAGAPPKPLSDRLALLDRLIEAHKAVKTIERDDALGRYAFGDRWRGADSDWEQVSKIHGWNRRNQTGEDPAAEAAACRALAAALSDAERAALPQLAEDAERAAASAGRLLEAAAAPVALDTDEAFGVAALIDVPLNAAADRLDAWGASPDGLTRFLGFNAQRARARAAGLGELIERLEDGRVAADDALHAFDLARYEAVLRKAFADRPVLAAFDGAAHEQRLSTFRTLDKDRMTLARREVAAAHHGGLPSGSALGEVGVLKREFQKKRNHLPLRRLLSEAGQAIQAIKPVFMMSPMSVAQFLERGGGDGGLSFDLMLMDEASQVRPVDALGAVARSRQLVVVGDDKQLPPTRFFATSVSADETGEQDAADLNTADLESILGLCTAQNMPGTMLRWHYRSKHPSLIAVSNRAFYDDQLQVIPSPARRPEDLGVRFHKITDGYFDRGGSATHRVEAQRIAAAVVEHARESPHRSLGVGAFSVGQRDLILDELEALRREHHDVDGFFAEDVEEPFFVKNLENIQGDERDVIFISVGYGPDREGNVSMNFGPLSADGGERRLNVLITRAKRRLEVFSSLVAGDIDLGRVSRRGPAAFKTFLAFAEHGHFTNAEAGDDAAGSAAGGAGTFEAAVIDALAARGLAAEARVGAKGFYVDVAVVDPTDESRYALAVLTDGPGYAASRSARERDASREGVLKMMGWNTLRVWSLDWFNRPGEQADRIVAAVEAATRGDEEVDADAAPAAGPSAVQGIERDEPEGPAEVALVPYREASFKKTPRKDLDDLDPNQLMDLVVRVVEAEEPVHGDEVTRRAADIYNVERLTAKLRKLLESALSDAAHAGRLDGSGGFYSLPGAVSTRLTAPRSRAEVASAGLRRPDRLPPAELRVALEQVVGSAIGVSVDDAVSEAARRLGYSSVRKPLRAVIQRELKALLDFGVLVNEDGALAAAGPPPKVESEK